MIKLGELDTSLEDVNGYLQQVEDELSQLDNVHGDPKYLETHIKKLKVGVRLQTTMAASNGGDNLLYYIVL